MPKFYYYRKHLEPKAQLLHVGEFQRKNSLLKPSSYRRLILSDGLFETLADQFIEAGWRVIDIDISEARAGKIENAIMSLKDYQPRLRFADFKGCDPFMNATFRKGLNKATLTVGGGLRLTDKTCLNNDLSFLFDLQLPYYLYK